MYCVKSSCKVNTCLFEACPTEGASGSEAVCNPRLAWTESVEGYAQDVYRDMSNWWLQILYWWVYLGSLPLMQHRLHCRPCLDTYKVLVAW